MPSRTPREEDWGGLVKTASFRRTVKSMDVATPAGLRNCALLLLGFTGTFRRSALNVEDMTFNKKGLIIAFDQSKTNQTGQAHERAIQVLGNGRGSWQQAEQQRAPAWSSANNGS